VSAPESLLNEAFGNHGEAMRERAKGIDSRPVESARVSKSIGEEATFSDNVADSKRIISAITAHSEKVAARARRSGLKGETVMLKVKLARRKAWGEKLVSNHDLFPVFTRQAKLKMACSSGDEISAAAVSLFRQLNLQEPIRLVGVTLTDLKSEHDPRQMDLFDARPRGIDVDASNTKSEALGRVLDAICDKFGEGSVGRAVSHIEKITHGDRIKAGEAPNAIESEPVALDAFESDP
jgi:DNA polymerase-4